MKHVPMLLAVVLAAALVLTWLTPWRYDHVGPVLVRTHRILGTSERLSPGQGWVMIRPQSVAK